MNIPNMSKQQSGYALIISLILLLSMTILGISAMSTNSLQYKMASNSQQKTVSLMEAEATLRTAEVNAALLAEVLNTTPSATSFTDDQGDTRKFINVKDGTTAQVGTPKASPCSATDQATLETTCDIFDPTFWTAGQGSINVVIPDPSNASNLYVIEYLGDKTISFLDEPTNVRVFRITVRGHGEDINAVTTVQSIFMRRNAS